MGGKKTVKSKELIFVCSNCHQRWVETLPKGYSLRWDVSMGRHEICRNGDVLVTAVKCPSCGGVKSVVRMQARHKGNWRYRGW